MHGKVVSMKPAALQRKRTHKDVKALDSEQNQIQVNDLLIYLISKVYIFTHFWDLA